MLIPDSELTKWPYLAVNGEKEGGIWFYDRAMPMPSRTTACDNQPGQNGVCNCPESKYPDHNVQTYWSSGQFPQGGENPMRGGMAFWEVDRPSPGKSYIYTAPYGSPLTQYPLCDNSNATGPIDTTTCSNVQITSTSVTFDTGVTPAISAASTTASDAIVWAIWATGDNQNNSHNGGIGLPIKPGVLYAFDAANVSQPPLYSSSGCTNGRDRIAPGVKFSVPTVANGYVYVGAEQCAWNGADCSGSDGKGNDGAGTFYIFTGGMNSC